MTEHPSGGPRRSGEGPPSNGARPSALARFVAGLGVDREDRPAALADLDERFLTVASKRGAGAARRWYWWQALRGIGHRLVPDFDLLSQKSWEGIQGDVRRRVHMEARRLGEFSRSSQQVDLTVRTVVLRVLPRECATSVSCGGVR